MQENDIKGKKLLILAGADVHCKVVRAAQELGVYVIVTDYLKPEQSPAKLIADEYWMLDIMDVDGIADRCKNKQVDGVLAYCIDPAQIPYQSICERLGVPCYGTKEQFEIMTDKRRFKELCVKCGVDVVPDYTEKDVETGRAIFPILVKPADSRGSRGQTVCRCKEEAGKALALARRESSRGGVVLERYMYGKQDFSVSYIVIDAVPYILKIGDRYVGRAADNLERQHICTILPSLFAPVYVELVDPKVRKLIKNLGLKFGAVFLQGFIDGSNVYFYDPGLRFPGSDFDLILRHSTGFDPMKSMVRFALTGDTSSCCGEPKEAYRLNGKTGIILSIAAKHGKIGTFDGFDAIAAHRDVLSVSKRYEPGEEVQETGDLKQRVAEIVACLPNRSDADEFVHSVYQTVAVLDEQGEDMILSKMGTDIPFV